MRIENWLLVGSLLLCCTELAAQDSLRVERTIGHDYDSLGISERNEQRFDTLEARTRRRAVPRMIYGLLVTSRPTLQQVETGVRDDAKLFRPYQGQRIARIDITPLGLLAGSDSTFIERVANSLHVTSRPVTIRRDLLFREGDALDADLLVASQQKLQSRPYIAGVAIDVHPHETLPGEVVIDICTEDNWTISGTGSVSGNGRSSLEVYDANILGYGARLGVAEHFNWKEWSHGGAEVELQVPNLLGTRLDMDLAAGKHFDDSRLGIDLKKQFLVPTDYAGGIRLQKLMQDTYLLYADSSQQVGSSELDLWAGKSFYIEGLRSSFYVAGHYTHFIFDKRPAETSPTFNPAFHDRRRLLGSVGLYRERFWASNLIYGYGQREYLATGYRLEALGGYSDDEFDDQWYNSLSYRLGKFVGWGYLTGSVELGSFYSLGQHRWSRGALKLEGHSFSNPWSVGPQMRLRQFVTMSILRGWSRYAGTEELLAFRDLYKLRGLSEWAVGVNRAAVSLESVLFTPWQPLGFRLALFSYADMGLLGDHDNLLRNPFYATAGIGVRFKNERLIFGALELRLGFALSNKGFLPAQYVALSGQTQIQPTRFRPEAPTIIPYR